MKASELTDRELQQVIAEYQGWKNCALHDNGLGLMGMQTDRRPGSKLVDFVPNYTTDLNAAGELIKSLIIENFQVTIKWGWAEDGLYCCNEFLPRAISEVYYDKFILSETADA